MIEDANWHLLFWPAFWVFVLVVLALWWIPTQVARKALNGRWRSWVLAPSIPFQISSRNAWPFMFAAASVSLGIALLSLPAEVLGWERARQTVWDLFFAPWAFVILSFAWWPLWLSPRWYRSWGQAGGTRETNPWMEEEVAIVQAKEPSKKRAKQLADIERCAEILRGLPTPGGAAETCHGDLSEETA
ncbi:MAG: hypothetical protein L0J58_04180 [Micrococcaceae bacterium]|uniref:hypothetical protein n=1 Tax=unclassified Arthrobacter TaxID=235627 RepID=UPI00265057F0|nr:hypothetical protein [Micrococcaceae bacterium]MDN6331731.1 hypothetical protein [Micrococcaceae bacterium]